MSKNELVELLANKVNNAADGNYPWINNKHMKLIYDSYCKICENSIHVVPIDDVKEHWENGSRCHCNPGLGVENGILIVIHNAYDGRK